MLDPWFKRTYPIKHIKKWTYWPWADYRVLRDAKAVLFTTEQERLLARQSFWMYRVRSRWWATRPQHHPPIQLASDPSFGNTFPSSAVSESCSFSAASIPKKG